MNRLDNKFAIAVIQDNISSADNDLFKAALETAIKALEENHQLKLRNKGLEKTVDSLLKGD